MQAKATLSSCQPRMLQQGRRRRSGEADRTPSLSKAQDFNMMRCRIVTPSWHAFAKGLCLIAVFMRLALLFHSGRTKSASM